MSKITYLIPKPSSDGGMTAITKMLYEINYFDNRQFFHFNTSYVSSSKSGRLTEFVVRMFQFIKHLAVVKPDAIFVMSNSYLGFYEKCLYCLIGRVWGVKSMLNHVGGEFDKFYKQGINRFFIRFFVRFPSALLIGSTFWSNYFRTLFPGVRVFSVPNPIIAKAYNQVGTIYHARDRFVIVSLFRLVKEKGVNELLTVIKAICGQFQEVEFVIIGEGPMLEDVRTDLVEFTKKGCVRILGFVDDATKIKEISNCHVYLMLTHFDLMPISIMEAMAASKPVLSTNVGGIPDMVDDGKSGFLFLVGETEAVVNTLKRFIENRALAEAMGIEGRKKVDSTFDISIVTALHQQVANDLVGNG